MTRHFHNKPKSWPRATIIVILAFFQQWGKKSKQNTITVHKFGHFHQLACHSHDDFSWKTLENLGKKTIFEAVKLA